MLNRVAIVLFLVGIPTLLLGVALVLWTTTAQADVSVGGGGVSGTPVPSQVATPINRGCPPLCH